MVFAVAAGALSAIFEFTIGQLFGVNMQDSKLPDHSCLTDTLWDLIVGALGALVISVFGWWYLKRHVRPFLEDWIGKFIERKPRLFPS